MRQRTLIFAVLLLLPLSCVRETLRDDAPGGEIVFSLEDTKAQLVEDAAAVAEAYGEAGIGLVAYGYDWADGVRTRYPWGSEAYDSFDYASRKAYRLTRDARGLWHADVRSLRWTREVRFLDFFAFAPFDLPVVSGEHSLPVLSGFTVEDPSTQADILVAHVSGSDAMPPVNKQRVPLVFSHPLAALQICNRTGQTLSQVRLTGVKDQASAYSFDAGSWTLKAHTTSYPLADVAAGETSARYLLLPQDVSGVTLSFVAGGKAVEAQLSGRWEPGQLFTYTVDDRVWDYVLDIPVTQLDVAFGATEHVLSLESYKTDGYNYVQEDWTVSFFSDAACAHSIGQPSWLSVSQNAASGTPGTASSLTISTLENNEGGVVRLQGDDAVRAAPERYYWNLANPNGSLGYNVETANCYIVNAPGLYIFPLVMGNAIKNGGWNYDAFGGASDYRGNYIQYDARLGGWTLNPSTWQGVVSGTPAWARVLWEDVDGLISTDASGYLPALVPGYDSSVIGEIDPQNGSSTYYLSFQVPLRQERMVGNAVIVVFDAHGVLMWSWHIWVTDYVPGGSSDVTLDGTRFMPRNIGEVRWMSQYPEHTVYVKLASRGNASVSRVIKVVKAGGEGTQMALSSHPYFQHGRKDPFIPGMGLDDVPVYGFNSLTSRTEQNSAIRSGGIAAQLSVWESIQHPNYFGASTGGSHAWYWTGEAHSTFWRSSKSLFDPSPAGYHVPSAAQLEALPFSSASYVPDVCVSLDGLVIPFTNRRTSNPGGGNYSGLITLNGGAAHAALWSADVDGDNNARYLRVQTSGHAVASMRGREALAVRPVAD